MGDIQEDAGWACERGAVLSSIDRLVASPGRRDFADVPEYAGAWCVAESVLGYLLESLGRRTDSEQAHRLAVDQCERLLTSSRTSSNTATSSRTAITSTGRALMTAGGLMRRRGRAPAGVSGINECAPWAKHPQYQSGLAAMYHNLGVRMWAKGRPRGRRGVLPREPSPHGNRLPRALRIELITGLTSHSALITWAWSWILRPSSQRRRNMPARP